MSFASIGSVRGMVEAGAALDLGPAGISGLVDRMKVSAALAVHSSSP